MGGLAQIEPCDGRDIGLKHCSMIGLVGTQRPAGGSVDLDAGAHLATSIGCADAEAACAREQVNDWHPPAASGRGEECAAVDSGSRRLAFRIWQHSLSPPVKVERKLEAVFSQACSQGRGNVFAFYGKDFFILSE